MKNVIEKLKRQTGFTETERVIAGYILAHSEDMYDLSLSELARRSCTSNAGVVRLCKKMGCKGWRDFQIEFLVEMRLRELTQ